MKYIIGLVVSIIMGASAYAQDNKDDATSSTKETEMTAPEDSKVPVETTAQSGAPHVGKQCALNNEFQDREGKFKEKKAYGDGELEIEREKDGDKKVEYNSTVESYKYKAGKNNIKERYKYTAIDNNGKIEVERKKDGGAKVSFKGVYPDVESAMKAIDQGLRVENYGRSCLSGLTEEDHANETEEQGDHYTDL